MIDRFTMRDAKEIYRNKIYEQYKKNEDIIDHILLDAYAEIEGAIKTGGSSSMINFCNMDLKTKEIKDVIIYLLAEDGFKAEISTNYFDRIYLSFNNANKPIGI